MKVSFTFSVWLDNSYVHIPVVLIDFRKNRIGAHNTAPKVGIHGGFIQNSVSKMGFGFKFYGMGWVSSQLYDFYLEI